TYQAPHQPSKQPQRPYLPPPAAPVQHQPKPRLRGPRIGEHNNTTVGRHDRRNTMPDTPPPSTHHAEVASHIPGRLRVRLHRRSRHPHVMMQLKKTIEEHQGIHGVEVNHAAGSITVKYDEQTHGGPGIFDVLEDLEV